MFVVVQLGLCRSNTKCNGTALTLWFHAWCGVQASVVTWLVGRQVVKVGINCFTNDDIEMGAYLVEIVAVIVALVVIASRELGLFVQMWVIIVMGELGQIV